MNKYHTMGNRKAVRAVARVMILCLAYQFIFPNVVMALTSGPSQPEVQSFEPVGTTDMVDLFSGDFVYNIPLLDVEGYPINISYHSGINMEQEASWVGLGWNINPGVINRGIRGLPDDFNGDVVERQLNINPEKNLKIGAGLGGELLGKTQSFNANIYVNSNNYKGLSAGVGGGVNVSAFGFASAGVNMGISSQNGVDIDYGASVTYYTSGSLSREYAGGIGLNAGGGYNTRNGVKDLNLNVSVKFKDEFANKKSEASAGVVSETIPIGLQNYVPVITNSSTLQGFSVSIAGGVEGFGAFGYANVNLAMSKLTYNSNGSRNAYGYLYLQNAGDNDIMDFTRDKDGMFNKTMKYLPAANNTYDVYSVCAQGTGGIFRPFRNDNGFISDPYTVSSSRNTSNAVEGGIGDVLEVGADVSVFNTKMSSGKWSSASRRFQKKPNGSLFENVYFKQAGELTELDNGYYNAIKTTHPLSITPSNLSALPAIKTYSDPNQFRDPRGSLVYYMTGGEVAEDSEFAFSTYYLQNYTDSTGLKNGPSTAKVNIPRVNATTRPKDRISEIIQENKDGSRYVYGLPAVNNIQKEVTFGVSQFSPSVVNDTNGTITYQANDDSIANNVGKEHFYSMTVTPAYAHSFMLTNVLSADYVDVTGNGPSDDDLGTYVKFNYSLRDSDYRWRVPYANGVAMYTPGFYCDHDDNKASYISGSKEEWYLHSIETKNFVAEFYTSKRDDGKGATGKVLPGNSMYSQGAYAAMAYNNNITTAGRSSEYKLDSIKLYNKHDRFINQGNAVPIKTVYFQYSYRLCPNTPNSVGVFGATTGGKLTLEKIYIQYGNSDKNLLSPYKFTYSTNNPAYNMALKDRWGNYKETNDPNARNHEYPYVDQNNPNNDTDASAWLLTGINLPSGGNININYESDDYSYVQNKRAMEMFKVAGVGTAPNFQPDSFTLYNNRTSPHNYIYFKRKTGSEFSSDMRSNYLEGQSVLYYNFGVDIAGKNTSEAVRGYAQILDVGVCPDNANYGYIKIQGKTPVGSSAYLSPITYTGLNMARYYLPQLFYPGSDPDESDLQNIVDGLVDGVKTLIHILRNPLDEYVKENKAKNYNINRSFVRLCTPNLRKKGGGSRVKQIVINDSWNNMAGGNNATGQFGNTYDYTINDPVYGTISSGVASYEPLIGGDENPFRMPANYIATNATSFPPNDPVELYQEEPIGESLYPSASVGYSQVTVRSIHIDKARSAQTQDVYQYYTAKDFPIRVEATAADVDENESRGILKSSSTFTGTQAYSIIMNDMHGKPKSVQNYVLRSDTLTELVASKTYLYNTVGNQLDNNVNVLAYNSWSNSFQQRQGVLGEDIDVTVDSRDKEEHTDISNTQVNTNTFVVWLIPVPIVTTILPPSHHDRSFRSLVSTKIVQQYGILKGVETTKEGAKFYAENVAYNPETGDVLLTKTNNEFKDPEYHMNYPAYWGHRTMSPAYRNIGYEFDYNAGPIPAPHVAQDFYLDLTSGTIITGLEVGDEVAISYKDYAGGLHYIKAWVLGFRFFGKFPIAILKSRYPDRWYSTYMPSGSPLPLSADSITIQHVKVIRSGFRNMVDQTMQMTVSLDNPVDATNILHFDPQKVLSATVRTYVDSTQFLPWHSGNPLEIYPVTMDTNYYVYGYLGNPRLSTEATYLATRDYTSAHDRLDGTFAIATPYWHAMPFTTDFVATHLWSPFMYNPAVSASAVNNPWKTVHQVNKYTPYGNEIENVDALG
ncbi:MAG: hypothetical protein JSU01_03810, partial [Bacteroidetes bacterium]|nr:hypothetical protein [Bacteroidota bacterium]